MIVNQLSAFIENKAGRLHKFTTVLAENNIDLLTLSIADTKDYGILRAITKDNDKAVAVLKAAGFTVSITKLIGVEVTDAPGGLAKILEIFDEGKISVEYLYSYARTSKGSAVILLKVENIEDATKLLEEHGAKGISSIL